ncbi:MAG: hypothetical protein WC538_14190 [Thermoanaerobaculia bacterium]|jgi:hypothetical protein
MSTVIPVSIPRWQWRTFAADLPSLALRFPELVQGSERRVDEIHLVCLKSSHHAFLRGSTLELRWRKEVGPEGFELWDTVLHSSLPFRGEQLARLWSAWGLPGPAPNIEYRTVASFLDEAIAPNPTVIPVTLTRWRREGRLHGIDCSVEAVEIRGAAAMQSLSLEHEDPALIEQLLIELGLDARDNVNFLQGIKTALGLPATDARERTWARKSNASF